MSLQIARIEQSANPALTVRRSGLHKLGIESDGDLVANENAASLECSIPGQAEVLSVDFCGRRDGNTCVAPGVEVCTGAAVLAMGNILIYFIGLSRIDIDISDVEYNCGIHIFMEKGKRPPEALHAWLIMLKAWQSMSRYLLPTLMEEGLGESDFRVLEVLLHKGPMPVNTIGPKVDLNPGSVSVAVDRLYKKGFVSRVECSADRRVRTVSLTEKGQQMFVPLFRRHTGLIKRAFRDVSSEEVKQLEGVLKKIGKRAESLAEKKDH